MTQEKVGPKEQQLRNLRAAKAAKRGWVSKKKQREQVKVLRQQINREKSQ